MIPLNDDLLLEAVNALSHASGNKAEAARALDIPVSTLKHRLRLATRKNLMGDAFGGHTPEGYSLGRITQLYRSEDGKITEWRHLHPDDETASPLEALEEWANAAITPLPSVAQISRELPLGERFSEEPTLATVYPIPDVHLGQYSWGRETGNAYDLDIAVETVKRTFGALVERAAMTPEAVVLGLGDYFHADGNDARTPKDKFQLDVDTRYGKVQWMGAELLIQVVDMALQKHEHVTVKVLSGNHDPRGGDTLTIALWFRYGNNPRVTIDRSPGLYWFWQWGKTMVAAHHGHEVSPERMPGIMASFEPEMWGSSQFRYAYLGHMHRRSKGLNQNEAGGAVWEIFQAITAKDAFNRSKGHASGRSICAITLDKERGEVFRHYEPIL